MSFLQILLLAVVQGAAELLPVSSSAHVVVAEKLMGLDPTTPQMTFLLVMLHTGTMLAVVGYFWKSWRARLFSSPQALQESAKLVAVATVMTGVIGLALTVLIERVALRGSPNAEIEQLFGDAYVIAAGLAAAGGMIILSGRRAARRASLPASFPATAASPQLSRRQALWIGAIQGLCLPFRGFSRSGSTISMGLFLDVDRTRAEEFSFALAVVLTPVVIFREGHRLLKSQSHAPTSVHELSAMVAPSVVGLLCSFVAGWLALRWLSRWLERGRWHFFGYYCLLAALTVLLINRFGATAS